jgi:outer membrane receptor protein involved in Fe transport
VGTSTSAGYFDNFGETLRQGIELGASGRYRRFDWSASYSYLHATFRSDACVLAENNSSAGASALCAGDEIRVKSGDRIPGLPAHSLKLGLSWKALDWLRVGGDVQAFSSQYVRGNENNQHRAGSTGGETYEGPGKIPGYAIVNVNADADLGAGWEMFAKVTNLFDKHYATGGILAENPFANGAFQADPDDWRHETFVAPGAPRAGWIGVRYRFGGR